MSETTTYTRSHGIISLKSTHKDVRRLKREGMIPSIHGNKVWSSCFALMSWLDEHPLPANQRVLDVGCGWGVLSCYLAKQQKARVTGADADPSVEPFFELTAKVNGVSVPFIKKRIEQLTGAMLTNFDVITGSDICFWDDMTRLLYNMIRRALRQNVKHIYISDPGRSPFWALADQCAQDFYGEVISRQTGKTAATQRHILVIHNE